MSVSRDDLTRVLSDVRRAYRLLQVYHRRLCDLLDSLHDVLAGGGLAFDRWEPMNVWRLPKPKTPFFRPEQWAWDLTPAYQVRCAWEQAAKGRSRRVIVEAIADTGYTASDEGEPEPSAFKDAEQCATELRVILWTARAKRADWDAAWQKVEQIADPNDGESHAVDVDGVEHTCRCLRVDVADLVDAQAVREKLLDPVEEWLVRA
jgi:hypothetical protein